MNPLPELRAQVVPFVASYDATGQDLVWAQHSAAFRTFWQHRILAPGAEPINDDDCDPVIRILDRNAKGNTKTSESVARAMVPQGAWRRMLNRLHVDKALGGALDAALTETDPGRKAAAIDKVYQLNQGERNYLTGGSGNAVCAFLAAYDPVANLSVISLKDRRTLLEYLGVDANCDWDTGGIGTRIVRTNEALLGAARELGLAGSARTVSRFFYVPEVKPLWKGEDTVQLSGHSVTVNVPTDAADEDAAVATGLPGTGAAGTAPADGSAADEVRESMQIQALLAKIGTRMGFAIWLPKNDRSRVLKLWTPEPGELLDVLPLGFDATTTKTVEQIDVLWLRRRSIARAFEVEHTTSIYSGLLRMADLVALQPDIHVKLHIVASVERQAKVLQEINRPVFTMLERRPLRDMCTFLSYDHIRELAEQKHLGRLSDLVLDDYEVAAEADDDL